MTEQNRIVRFPVARRIEHLVLVLSFSLLALTGLPQKYAAAGISQAIISILGGIETVRIIHRISATVFLLQSLYHLILMGYKLYVVKEKASMWLGLKDIKDGLQTFGYNFGIVKTRPKMGRFNFVEKIEYYAMIWGLVMMGLTGYMLWNPIVTTQSLPGQFIPAAKAAHGMEAVLAVLAILVWHFYSVHLKHWNWSMINGTISREEMEEEHVLELEEIDTGKTLAPVTAEEKRKRMTVFIPIASVLSLLGIFGVYQFINIENTSLTTIVPVVNYTAVYVPQTPTPAPTAAPTNTPAPTTPAPAGGTTAVAALTWDTGISNIFAANCKMCHGASGGLDLSSYAGITKGGTNGAAVVPGDPANSLIIKKMAGTHPKVLSPDDLQKVSDWIKAGALEK